MTFLFNYQKARQQAMALPDKSEAAVLEIAQLRGLSDAFTRILVAVVLHWKTDNDAFSDVLEAIYDDEGNGILECALAAENASSRYFFDGDTSAGLYWSGRALALAKKLDPDDAEMIEAKVNFGIWDNTDQKPTKDEVDRALGVLYDFGSYDVSGRVLAVVKNDFYGNGAQDPDEKEGWLRAVAMMSVDETAVNIYYHGKCVDALAGG